VRATAIVAGCGSVLRSIWTDCRRRTFCSNRGIHAFYVPGSRPDRITVNARCLDGIEGPSLKPTRFFEGPHREEAQRRRIAESGKAPAPRLKGAVTLQRILGSAPVETDHPR
jgi:hypothetical protein